MKEEEHVALDSRSTTTSSQSTVIRLPNTSFMAITKYKNGQVRTCTSLWNCWIKLEIDQFECCIGCI